MHSSIRSPSPLHSVQTLFRFGVFFCGFRFVMGSLDCFLHCFFRCLFCHLELVAEETSEKSSIHRNNRLLRGRNTGRFCAEFRGVERRAISREWYVLRPTPSNRHPNRHQKTNKTARVEVVPALRRESQSQFETQSKPPVESEIRKFLC